MFWLWHLQGGTKSINKLKLKTYDKRWYMNWNLPVFIRDTGMHRVGKSVRMHSFIWNSCHHELHTAPIRTHGIILGRLCKMFNTDSSKTRQIKFWYGIKDIIGKRFYVNFVPQKLLIPWSIIHTHCFISGTCWIVSRGNWWSYCRIPWAEDQRTWS